MIKSRIKSNSKKINRIIQINQIHTYSILTRNFKVEKIIHVKHKNRKFMFDIILNFQKMTYVNMSDQIENNYYHDKNENYSNY